MTSTKVDLALRRNKCAKIFDRYKRHFAGFDGAKHVPPPDSDEVLSKVSNLFSKEVEASSTEDIESILSAFDTSEYSYLFTDDYVNCGLFRTLTWQALKNAVRIAKQDVGGTSFVLDEEGRFLVRVNYSPEADELDIVVRLRETDPHRSSRRHSG